MINIDEVPEIARLIFGKSVLPDNVLTKIGDDDCGVLQSGSEQLVFTTDLMNHRPALMTLNVRNRFFNYGYLMAIANLSDLYGTGARPTVMLVGLLVPDTLKPKQIDQVLRGVQSCCRQHKVTVIGGDTKRADRFQGYAVAVGYAEEGHQLFLRNGVVPGQDIYLSGPVGEFNASVYVMSLDSYPKEWSGRALKAITRPILRRGLSLGLARRCLATGGLDVSDGLGLDLWRLSKASGVLLEITAESIPVGKFAQMVAARYHVDPLAFAFATGGDWQFVFSADPKHRASCTKLGATRIGVAKEGSGCWLAQGDEVTPLSEFGHSDDRRLEFGEEVRLGIQQFSARS